MSSIGRIGGLLHDGELCRVHYSRQQPESLDMGFRCVPVSKLRLLIGGWFRTHFWVLRRHPSPSRGNQRVVLGATNASLTVIVCLVALRALACSPRQASHRCRAPWGISPVGHDTDSSPLSRYPMHGARGAWHALPSGVVAPHVHRRRPAGPGLPSRDKDRRRPAEGHRRHGALVATTGHYPVDALCALVTEVYGIPDPRPGTNVRENAEQALLAYAQQQRRGQATRTGVPGIGW